jgi:hypothetical protein
MTFSNLKPEDWQAIYRRHPAAFHHMLSVAQYREFEILKDLVKRDVATPWQRRRHAELKRLQEVQDERLAEHLREVDAFPPSV